MPDVSASPVDARRAVLDALDGCIRQRERERDAYRTVALLALTYLAEVTPERDRLRACYHRQIELNRSLRARLVGHEPVDA